MILFEGLNDLITFVVMFLIICRFSHNFTVLFLSVRSHLGMVCPKGEEGKKKPSALHFDEDTVASQIKLAHG